MRITHYLRRMSLVQGGVVRAVMDLSARMAARGHRVRVVTYSDEDAPRAWRDGGEGLPEVVLIDRPRLPGDMFSGSQLRAWDGVLADTDVLHLHAAWNPANSQLAARSRRHGVPYVVSVHGMLDDWCMTQRGLRKRAFLALAGRRLLEGAATVHVTAQGELEQAARWFPKGRGLVVPLVFDVEPFRALPPAELAERAFDAIRPDEPLVLFLSRIHYKKGVDVLLGALRILDGRGVRFTAVIAGAGDERYVRRMKERAAGAGISDRVAFVGMVTGETKLALYRRADVFALPTSQENFGFVLPEALACGTPAVTTRGVDIWPELVEGGGAVVCERTDSAFADEIGRLLADPRRRREVGEAGRRWVFEHLDPDTVVSRFEAMYERAASAAGEAA